METETGCRGRGLSRCRAHIARATCAPSAGSFLSCSFAPRRVWVPFLDHGFALRWHSSPPPPPLEYRYQVNCTSYHLPHPIPASVASSSQPHIISPSAPIDQSPRRILYLSVSRN
ncbi:hypothetical protein B0H17DRAFT_1087247 [Mycena rosella]|uniref:Uncharacterized protein n=1 Tax=Mycena rosella TaxID=1033263 RepID=A0AAD7CY29_MYCRO|nr:hypothetical protein B0H17DRAFT_1087247 [Mycena rosella]